MRRFLELGLILGLLGVSALTACSPSETASVFGSGAATSGPGGAGGEGGAGTAATSGSSSNGSGGGSSNSSSSSSGSGSSSVAASGASASVSSSAASSSSSSGAGGFDPQQCGQCAFGACQTEIFACGQACQPFLTCSQACADKACVDECLEKTPQAKPVYECTCAACAADCGSYCGGGGSGNSGSSASSSSSGGGGACATCGDILQGSAETPCQGSDQLAFALYNCTCMMSCKSECATSCQGGGVDQACTNCTQSQCGKQLSACLAD
jgi:hypothetical protein